ncbi:Ig-like domain-containing protein [Marinomonas pollencensis]|uniref:Ig-like domain-containing protein n=1 Tax=Marinomonas pollencensis TaxID=491954 RepID=UPI002482A016|nr:Ig-like domain-containing protein [Marinomonas pollencensis]
MGGDASEGDTVTLSVTLNDGTTASYSGLVSDAGTYSIGIPSAVLSVLNDTTISASVSGTDAAGNTFTAVSDAADGGFTVDTSVSGLTSDITDATNSGSNDDTITNDATPDISGVTEAGATVTITYMDATNTERMATGTADEDGNYTIAITNALAEGSTSLSITAVDVAGNESTTTQNVTVDTLIDAPVITNITDDSANSDYSTVTLHGTGEPGTSITLHVISGSSVNGNNTQTGEYVEVEGLSIIVDENGNWTADVSNLTDVQVNDNEFFKATQTDAAGNVSADSNTAHYWHGSATSISTEVGDDFVLTGAGNDQVTVSTDDANDGLTIDGGAGVDTVIFQSFDASQATFVVDDNGNLQITRGDTGDVVLLIDVENVKIDGDTYTISDLFTPTVAITNDTNNDGLLNSDEANGSVTVSIDLPIGAKVGDTINVTSNNGEPDRVITLNSNNISNGSVSVSGIAVTEGETLEVSASLSTGGGVGSDSALVDTSVSGLTADITDATNSGSNDDTITNNVTPTIAGQTEPGASVTITYTDVSGTEQTTDAVTADTDGNYSITIPAALDEGSSDLTVKAIDAAGNETTTTQNVTVDTSVSGLTADITNATNSGSNDDSITNNATPTIAGQTEPGASVAILYTDATGTQQTATGTADESGTYSITLDNGLPEGTNSLNIKAIDAAGNETKIMHDVTIDTSVGSPTISIAGDANEDGVYNAEELGADGTVTATISVPDDFDADTDTLIINGEAVSADVIIDGQVTLEIDPNETITAQITDVAGNESVIASETALSADTTAAARISLDKVTEDNLVTHDEAASKVTLSGRVGGDAAVGDIVTLTIATAAGVMATYSANVVADDEDNLGYSYEVDGDVLYAYPDATITASVTGTDSAGNSFNASTSTTYDLGIGALSDADSDANVISEGAANGTEVQVTGLAVDPDGDAVKYSLSDDHNGAFAIDATTGVVTVADNTKLDYGSDSAPTIDITATSEDGTTDTATFTINLTADTVVAADMGIGTEDTTLTVSAEEGVLSNDSDADDRLLVATFTVDNDDTIYSAGDSVTIDGAGTLTLNGDGSYSFEPIANWSGDVPTVSYVTNTGAESTLSISIEGVNDAAEISLNNESVTVSEKGLEDSTAGTTSATGTFTVSDIDGDDLSVSLVAPTETYTSGNVPLTWDLNGEGDLIGSANGEAIVTVTLGDVNSSGEGSYTVTLNGPVDQSNTTADDSLSIQFGVAVNDGTSTTTSAVTAVIEDDEPSAVTTEAELQLTSSTFSISSIESGFSGELFEQSGYKLGTHSKTDDDNDDFNETLSWGNYAHKHNISAGESSVTASEVEDNSSGIGFGDSIVVAKITHENGLTNAAYADDLESATFNVDVSLIIDGKEEVVSLASKFTEVATSNSLVNSGDSLTLEASSATVEVNGTSYTVYLDGFLVNGEIVNTVTTDELAKVTYSVAAHVELTDSSPADEYVLTGTLNTDAGADGLDSVVEATTIDDNGTLVVNEDGTYSFTPSDALVSALGDTSSQVVEYSYSVVDGDGDSVTNTLSITVSSPDADTGTTTTVSGLSGSFYNYDDSAEGNSNITSIAQAESIIANQSANATFIATDVDYARAYNNLGSGTNLDSWLGSDSSSLTYVDQQSTEDSVVQLTGSVSLAAGAYSIKVSADDGYQIKINGEVVVYVDHIQAVATDISTFTVTESGEQSIEIVYWDQGGAYQLSVSLAPVTAVGGIGEYQVLGSDAYPTTSVVTDVSDIVTDTTDDVVGADDTTDDVVGADDGADTGTDASYQDDIAEYESRDYSNTINGTSNDDTISGTNHNDHIIGDNAQDNLSGGNGADWLEGGDGDDKLYGGNSADLLDGGRGQDYLEGGNSNDILFGGDGDDSLLGGHGNDILIGGQGNDTLTGDNGNDLFILQDPSTNGIDQITDFNVNNDALDVSDLLSADDVNLDDADAVTAYLNANIKLDSNDDGSGSLSVKDANGADHQVATFGSDSTLGEAGSTVTVVFNDQEYSVNVDG